MTIFCINYYPMKYFIFVLLLLVSNLTTAQNYEPKDVSEIQAQYNLLVDLKNEQAITESIFETKSNELKRLASEKFHVNLEGLDLKKIVPVQRINWIGSALYVISALLIFVLLSPLLAKLKKPFIALFKLVFDNEFFKSLVRLIFKFFIKIWEPASYIILAVNIYFINNEYIVLLTSFLSGTLLSYSILSRQIKDESPTSGNSVSFSLTILWGIIAYFHDNSFVGFMSVAAFISSIGFAMLMFPGMVAIGFEKNNSKFVLRLTGITFLLSLLSWLVFYTDYSPIFSILKTHLRVFEVGMVSLIPLVYFLGLGYMTFFLYRDTLWKKIICEITALISGIFVLTIALLYGIGSMFWIGLIFMTWDAIDKYHELVYKRVDFVWAGLILAAILATLGYFIKSNMTTIMTILDSLNL